MEFCSGFYKAGSENKIKQTVSKVFAINFFFFWQVGDSSYVLKQP